MARQHFGVAAELAEVGFSTRTINALVYELDLKSVDDLRAVPWEPLRLQLSRAPNVGKKTIAEVEAFRAGRDPRSAKPVQTYVSIPFDADGLAALDAWIAAQPKPVSRPEAIRAMVEASLEIMSK